MNSAIVSIAIRVEVEGKLYAFDEIPPGKAPELMANGTVRMSINGCSVCDHDWGFDGIEIVYDEAEKFAEFLVTKTEPIPKMSVTGIGPALRALPVDHQSTKCRIQVSYSSDLGWQELCGGIIVERELLAAALFHASEEYYQGRIDRGNDPDGLCLQRLSRSRARRSALFYPNVDRHE